MKDDYDMSVAQRGPVISSVGKTRLTLYLDDAVVEAFRQRAEAQGIGYQTLINETLKQCLVPEPASPAAKARPAPQRQPA
jgi:uncharacterized protein (DUF4415 family)